MMKKRNKDEFDKKMSEQDQKEDDEATQVIDVSDNHQEDEEIEEQDNDPIPNIQDMSRRLKKVVKVIDILEYVDSCLIVGERFLKDDEEAKKLIEEIREKILDTETLFTDYLITGKITRVV